MKKLNDLLLIIQARLKNLDKYKRTLEVKNHGFGHYSIEFDKSNEQILNQIRKDYNLDSQNNAKQKWYHLSFFK
jgi:hypothetical protein